MSVEGDVESVDGPTPCIQHITTQKKYIRVHKESNTKSLRTQKVPIPGQTHPMGNKELAMGRSKKTVNHSSTDRRLNLHSKTLCAPKETFKIIKLHSYFEVCTFKHLMLLQHCTTPTYK